MCAKSSYTLKSLPEEERPRERLMHKGADTLSLAELVAIILGNGTRGKSALQMGQEVVSCFGHSLSEVTVDELCQIKGLGCAKAVKLKAALALALRLREPAPLSKKPINSSKAAYTLLKPLFEGANKELFAALLLDARGMVIRGEVLSIGTLTQTLVHPRELFHLAIRHRAASLIVAHNHPSGDPTPSSQDFKLTEALLEASRIIAIPILDHLILTSTSFLSLRENGVDF